MTASVVDEHSAREAIKLFTIWVSNFSHTKRFYGWIVYSLLILHNNSWLLNLFHIKHFLRFRKMVVKRNEQVKI